MRRSVFPILFVVVMFFANSCVPRAGNDSPSPLASSSQCLLVIADTDTTVHAVMRLYLRNDAGAWVQDGESFGVSLGRNGLAWGRGLHTEADSSGVFKHEGDGKSPAGIFELGKIMGYAPASETGDLRMPYERITDSTECVDDGVSPYYNRIVRNDTTSGTWTSSEKMWKFAGWYDWLVVINHNTDPIEVGCGSCVFIHFRKNPTDHTAGCTALDSDPMLHLLGWLDSSKTPRLVQLTQAEYDKYSKKWDLPEIQ